MRSCCEKKVTGSSCAKDSGRGNRVNAGAGDGKAAKIGSCIHKQCNVGKKDFSHYTRLANTWGTKATTKRTSMVVTLISHVEFICSVIGGVGRSRLNPATAGSPKVLWKRQPPSSRPNPRIHQQSHLRVDVKRPASTPPVECKK
uniref:Uncharacterized protein n=1 Tax=Echinococcus granulosus TaxID=6210 RepID=A0A068WQC6_ECHGR|nr:hypothetical protein EgrG_002028000 [Echinococcus granulosus]